MQGRLIENRPLTGTYYYATIECPEFVKEAKIGQFLMIRPQLYPYINDPLLRRPFGIADINGDTFSILYTVIGKGTELLSEAKEGSVMHFSEPLGTGFSLPEEFSRVALVAGGVGIAPLLWLAKTCRERQCKTHLFMGGRSADDIVLIDKFEPITETVAVTTDDGSKGQKGFVTEAFAPVAHEHDMVYTCGPKMMLNAVSTICISSQLPVEVSLDERMACGIGACLGCIIITEENGEQKRKRCCVEGPVFDGRDVVWDSVCRTA